MRKYGSERVIEFDGGCAGDSDDGDESIYAHIANENDNMMTTSNGIRLVQYTCLLVSGIDMNGFAMCLCLQCDVQTIKKKSITPCSQIAKNKMQIIIINETITFAFVAASVQYTGMRDFLPLLIPSSRTTTTATAYFSFLFKFYFSEYF